MFPSSNSLEDNIFRTRGKKKKKRKREERKEEKEKRRNEIREERISWKRKDRNRNIII